MKTKIFFFNVGGWFFVVLGFIGVFLPVMPTTPFLLLAALCFSRGSPKFHRWLLNHKVFGPPIEDWEKNRVIRTPIKVFSTIALCFSGAFLIYREVSPWLLGVFFSTAVIAMTYVWMQKSR